MTDETVIRYCAPTLAALKAGSLFACLRESGQELHAGVRDLNRRLRGKGLCVLLMQRRDANYLVYVCRPELLTRDLNDPRAQAILHGCGYPCGQTNACLRLLRERMWTQAEFPHEIGLFLGYPPEDVEGFMAHKRAKCVGCWKVYGDEERAKELFRQYKRCTDRCCALWRAGSGLAQLAV